MSNNHQLRKVFLITVFAIALLSANAPFLSNVLRQFHNKMEMDIVSDDVFTDVINNHRTVMKDQDRWNLEIINSGNWSGWYSSMVIDSNDFPHISHYNVINKDLKYTFYDGNQWNTETVDFNGDVGLGSCLALDSNDRPHISFHDETNGNLKYAFKKEDTWQKDTLDTEGDVGDYTSIALDADDNPHISYSDQTNFDLKYAYFDGNLWHNETVNSMGVVGNYTSLELDSNGFPHICYTNETPELSQVKYAIWNGTGWSNETVDSTEYMEGYGNYAFLVSSFALDDDDHAHVCYQDLLSLKLKYAYHDGNQWNIEYVDTQEYTGFYPSLSLDSKNLPHISYGFSNGDVMCFDLKYAYNDGDHWNLKTVDYATLFSRSVGALSSIAVDSYDSPHITYIDDVNGDFNYARLLTDHSPMAEAGSDITIQQHEEVQFSGFDSTDDWEIVSYNWSFYYNGTIVYLQEMNSTYTFDMAGVYEVVLNVSDICGQWDTDTMIVTVIDITPPHAVATADNTTIHQYQTVNFSASSSQDNIGIAFYNWSFIYDGIVRTYDTMNLSFGFDIVGGYDIYLNVSDERGNFDTDMVHITVKDITHPIANAGPDITIAQHESVTFNASKSIDDVGIVSHSWFFYYDGNPYHFDVQTFEFTFHIAGGYEITLNVTDSAGYWDTDDLTVLVRDITPPTVNVVSNITIDQGATAIFDASGSTDNVGIINFSWTFFYNDTSYTLYQVRTNFTFHIAGLYNVALYAYDAEGNFGRANITVTVNDITPPIAIIRVDREVHQGVEAVLDGTLSIDNIGIVNFTWSFMYNNSQVLLYEATSHFTFDIIGIFNITLTVKDAMDNVGSNFLLITVAGEDNDDDSPGTEKDSDGDNYTDEEENASGSDPYNPKSTPLDWDGDGVPNDEDAYPRDASRWKSESSFPYRVLLVLGVVIIVTLLIILCYSRIKAGKVLEQGGRQEIYSYIRENPGEHYRAIRRKLGVSRGTLSHHLRKLEEAGMIQTRRVSYYKLFYPADSCSNVPPLTPGQRQVLDIIRTSSALSTIEIAQRVGKKPRTIRYHLHTLADRDLVRAERQNDHTVWVVPGTIGESG